MANNQLNLATTQTQTQTQTQTPSPNSSNSSLKKKKKNRKKWATIDATSTNLQFQFSDRKNKNNNNNNIGSSSAVDQDVYYGDDIDGIINNGITHRSSSQLKQLRNSKVYQKSYDAAINSKFNNNNNKNLFPQQQPQQRKRRSKYSITDIFAFHSSFILDYSYAEADICSLILSNSTQTQTKKKFIKSIWPHILRVITRVFVNSKHRCPICLDENIFIARITECGHCFCGTCLLHHLFSYQQSKKQDADQLIIPQIGIDDNYNFSDLFGYCPLCHEYVSFEQCRPLTVIRCNQYRENDSINMVLVERRKGEQPYFASSNSNNNLNISTFRKFETEQNELLKCDNEINEINKIFNSSDPIYEQPYLHLLLLNVKQYKSYIFQQRQAAFNRPTLVPINNNICNNNKPIIAKPNDNQQQIYKQQQHRYRKKKYVYQSCDGQLLFLHPHNYNMLKHDLNYNFGSFPLLLNNCVILEIETYIQSYDLRRKYPFLAFIPVDVEFSFIEIDISHIINDNTVKYYEKITNQRLNIRSQKQHIQIEEKKEKLRKEQEEINKNKKKYKKKQININDPTEFPSLNINNTDSSDTSSDNNINNNNNNNNNIKAINRSWSQITSNIKDITNVSTNENGNGNNSNKKRKRRRGRDKKKNKNKQ